jgi:hypothetical protein
LEIEIIKVLLFRYEKLRPEVALDARIDIGHLLKCDVDRFYGIEYEEFPAQIAQVAMWLMDHQMNMRVSETFGEYYVRLPLRKSAVIKHGNALRTDWQSLIEPLPWEKGEQKFDYIFGNPPFVGKSLQNAEQKKDMEMIFAGVKGAGVMDYVAAWYIKAAQYLKETSHIIKHESDYIKFEIEENFTLCAFVSTNSISQGEQVAVLWNELFNKYHIKIFFAHRTFKWGNEAKGNAAVHVVIIGFANFNYNPKSIYEYENIKGEPHEVKVKNINPYLVEGKDSILPSRTTTLCSVPQMSTGSTAVDNGYFLFSKSEKDAFILKEPNSQKYFKQFMGAYEFINNKSRYCLWLKDASPSELKTMPLVLQRINAVKEYRLTSKKVATRERARFSSVFAEIRQPLTDYLIVPSVSSERRVYIPIGYLNSKIIVSNLCTYVPNASFYSFGIIASIMHMVWVKNVAGRLESRYRYSTTVVYNNFPWPENPTEKQKQNVEAAAQHVLDVRAKFLTPGPSPKNGEGSKGASLADLYDPNTMPPELVKAHQQLDKAVDLCYRPQPFINETKRIEFLFELYDKLTSGMFAAKKKK